MAGCTEIASPQRLLILDASNTSRGHSTIEQIGDLANYRSSKLQSGAIAPQHALANNPHGHRSLLHEAVVKLHQAEVGAPQLPVILSQLQDLQLSKSVIEISGIGRAPPGFDLRHRRNLKTFFDEKLLPLGKRHLGGMHLDSNNEASIAQQGVH